MGDAHKIITFSSLLPLRSRACKQKDFSHAWGRKDAQAPGSVITCATARVPGPISRAECIQQGVVSECMRLQRGGEGECYNFMGVPVFELVTGCHDPHKGDTDLSSRIVTFLTDSLHRLRLPGLHGEQGPPSRLIPWNPLKYRGRRGEPRRAVRLSSSALILLKKRRQHGSPCAAAYRVDGRRERMPQEAPDSRISDQSRSGQRVFAPTMKKHLDVRPNPGMDSGAEEPDREAL